MDVHISAFQNKDVAARRTQIPILRAPLAPLYPIELVTAELRTWSPRDNKGWGLGPATFIQTLDGQSTTIAERGEAVFAPNDRSQHRAMQTD
jgi:hypothetical protein